MRVRLAAALSALLVAGVLVSATADPASADISCTQTVPTAPDTPTTPTPGAPPCWTDVSPYPFGFDGNPVDTGSASCQSWEQTVGLSDSIVCYLSVDSMAFRAWNRGIAVTSPPPIDRLSVPGNPPFATTPFGVWLYNGTRWFPDPTFPGQTVCKGSTVVWAGKLDYWVVGQIPNLGAPNWPALCRFDGVNYQWEPLPVPKAALAHVGVDATGNPVSGAIQTGACLAWNDCWFFGSYGVILHWDGQSLTDATPSSGTSSWLRTQFTAAVARIDSAGNPFAFAVGGPAASQNAPTAPPQVWHSGGGAFAPVDGFTPPPGQAPLVAVDFNSQGQGWVAGDHGGQPPSALPTSGASPIAPLSASGSVLPSCPGAAGSFTNSAAGGYLWSSISVLPNGEALAGGQYGSAGTFQAPVLAEVSCDQAPRLLSFGSGSLDAVIPEDPGGWISAAAANAVNDQWAAVTTNQTSSTPPSPPPHMYHLTDGAPPLAPAGDDVEPRPLVVQPEPSIFVIAPPVVVPSPPAAPPPASPGKPGTKHVKVPSPIYAIQKAKVFRSASGAYFLRIRFKVRAKVTIGIEALHRGKVVSSSGLKTFRGKTGELVLKLDLKHWPTSLKFVLPKTGQK